MACSVHAVIQPMSLIHLLGLERDEQRRRLRINHSVRINPIYTQRNCGRKPALLLSVQLAHDTEMLFRIILNHLRVVLQLVIRICKDHAHQGHQYGFLVADGKIVICLVCVLLLLL